LYLLSTILPSAYTLLLGGDEHGTKASFWPSKVSWSFGTGM